MGQYIDKAAVMAEIEKLRMNYGRIFNEYDAGFSEGRSSAFDDILSFLDTLEVKDVQEEPVSKDMQEALRMEYEKGRADVLRLIDPDEMVADFCSQPLSKTRSLASIYRQGITDILRKKNNQ